MTGALCYFEDMFFLFDKRFDNGGNNQEVASLSGQRMGVGGGVFKTISQIKDENLGMGEKVLIHVLFAYSSLGQSLGTSIDLVA